MSSQRIQAIEPPYPEDLQASFDVVMPPGAPPLTLFRTVARNPRVLSRMVRGGLLDRGSISLADRELVILRACGVCKSEYEWGVHAAIFAEKAGFSEEQVGASWTGGYEGTGFTDSQRLLLRLVDQLHESSTVSDDLWRGLAAVYDDAQLVELVMLAGLYHAVSFMTNALKIDKEAFGRPVPVSSTAP